MKIFFLNKNNNGKNEVYKLPIEVDLKSFQINIQIMDICRDDIVFLFENKKNKKYLYVNKKCKNDMNYFKAYLLCIYSKEKRWPEFLEIERSQLFIYNENNTLWSEDKQVLNLLIPEDYLKMAILKSNIKEANILSKIFCVSEKMMNTQLSLKGWA